MPAFFQGLGVWKRHPDPQLTVGIGVGALVAEVGDIPLTAPSEGFGERERRRRVIGCPSGARIDDGLRDPVRDADERDDVARVVDQHRLDEPGIAEREPTEIALGNEGARDIVLADHIEH